MHALRPTATALVTALALGSSPAAWAQSLSAKDAWEAIQAFVSGAGGQLSTTGLVREGDALVAQDAVLTSGDTPPSIEVRFGALRIEPEELGVALTPPPQFEAILRGAALGEERRYAITHDGAASLSLDETGLDMGLNFPGFAVEQTAATRRGRPLDERFSLGLTTLEGLASLTLEAPFTLNMALRAQRMTYALSMNDTEFMPIRQSVTSDTAGVEFTLDATGLELLDDSSGPGFIRRAFEAGFSAEAELIAGPSTGEVDQDIGGQALAMSLRAGDSSARVAAVDGSVSLQTAAEGYESDLRVNGIDGTARLARLALGLELPVIGGEQERRFGVVFDISDLSVSDSLLAPLGAASFAGDTATLQFDLEARGRWLVEITDNPDAADVPIDFGTITLTNLLTRIGQAALTGSGSFTFTPGTFMRSAGPDGTGDFVFELAGGEALLNRLAAAGILPPDQQFLARMMMNGLGRPIGPDRLRSEVAIRPGNQITVNGAPLPF